MEGHQFDGGAGRIIEVEPAGHLQGLPLQGDRGLVER
jgi:hypothetical protein